MPIRSMTGFAQVKGQANGQLNFVLSLKSVNHRFLDLHFRLPSDSDSLEMKLRRILKERLARGHVEIMLNLERAGEESFTLNRQMVGGYLQAFRAAATEFGLVAEPDLNAILRMPGAMDAGTLPANDALELRERMAHVKESAEKIGGYRQSVQRMYFEKLNARMQELLGAQVDRERAMQEAALLVDRSDIQEELVRLGTHVQHFVGMLDQEGEIGKKLDFLLQEMNREANTLMSKTSGLAGEAIKITELGLAMKADIEKVREQVQNIE
jgi:uncharacterized protein YicC (UPF0701 family)